MCKQLYLLFLRFSLKRKCYISVYELVLNDMKSGEISNYLLICLLMKSFRVGVTWFWEQLKEDVDWFIEVIVGIGQIFGYGSGYHEDSITYFIFGFN